MGRIERTIMIQTQRLLVKVDTGASMNGIREVGEGKQTAEQEDVVASRLRRGGMKSHVGGHLIILGV